MIALADGNAVFVAPDDFKDLQESPAVFGNLREFCTAAVLAAFAQGGNLWEEMTIDLDRADFSGPMPSLEGRTIRVSMRFLDCPEIPDLDALTQPPVTVNVSNEVSIPENILRALIRDEIYLYFKAQESKPPRRASRQAHGKA